MFNKMRGVKQEERARAEAVKRHAELVAQAFETAEAAAAMGAHGPAEVDPEILAAIESRTMRAANTHARLELALAAIGDHAVGAAATPQQVQFQLASALASGRSASSSAGAAPPQPALPFWPEGVNLRHRMFLVFSEPGSCLAGRYFGLFILLVIIYSCVIFCVQSLEEFRLEFELYGTEPDVFFYSELIAIIIFSVEYVTRVLTVSAVPLDRDVHKLARRVSTFRPDQNAELINAMHELKHQREPGHLKKMFDFVISPMNLVDLLAILPFYIERVVGSASGELAIVRVLRLARVFRVFKLGKYHSGLNLIGRVLYTSADALYLLLFFTFLGMVLFGAVMFTLEQGEFDPETNTFLRLDKHGKNFEESPFHSIPGTFYWVLVTSTTLGYGDIVPTTPAGKVVASILMHAGILMLALPITVIGANFAVEYAEQTGDRAVASTVHQAVNIEDLPQHKKARTNAAGGKNGNSRTPGGAPESKLAPDSRRLSDSRRASGSRGESTPSPRSVDEDDDVGDASRVLTVDDPDGIMSTARHDEHDARHLNESVAALLEQTRTLNANVAALMDRLGKSRQVFATAGEMPATEIGPEGSS